MMFVLLISEAAPLLVSVMKVLELAALTSELEQLIILGPHHGFCLFPRIQRNVSTELNRGLGSCWKIDNLVLPSLESIPFAYSVH